MGGPRPGAPMMPPMPQRPVTNGQDGGPSHSQQQHVIIDPNRYTKYCPPLVVYFSFNLFSTHPFTSVMGALTI